jgi:glyoxylate utilization-related uncharacterized protein
MKQINFSEVEAYNPPAHHGMVALKIQGEAESGITKFWQGVSHFLPNGGADMAYTEGTFGAAFDKTYFVISGEVTVIDADGKEFNLKPFDSIAILPNEGRKMINKTNQMATCLVTVSTS